MDSKGRTDKEEKVSELLKYTDSGTENNLELETFDDIYDEMCPFCGDTGRTQDNPYKCDKCGKIYTPQMDTVEIVTQIPDRFTGLSFSRTHFINTYESTTKSTRYSGFFLSVGDALEEILKGLKIGKMIDNTVYLSVPVELMEPLRLWCYNTIQATELNGFTSRDIIFLNDVDLETVQEDCIVKDWLVVYISNYKLKENLDKLDYICAKRGIYKRPTVILSPMPWQYLMKQLEYTSIVVDLDLSISLPREDFKGR